MKEPIPSRAYRLTQILNLDETELCERGFLFVQKSCLYPTPKGQQVLDEIEPLVNKHKDDSVFTGLKLNLVDDETAF
ncbi:hypothetical protein BegalDRAFT_3175 [Beggiatoa alba B18LD]|uniref:Transcriptional regulator n=1 Tax=Beggiatoa alba B18LD TaxID=395493 RepID=I3CK56_9GAMM|nr:hypothetical protein [Beggiatoa alba]EIJ43999.1 hypothetical protein BegalDRAFT_3175 [Beggiatoa alba B18LD]